ncbi:MAG: hypothetical protein C0598_02110 [Marinilabiliales bacterium]|nr:MAG: hypothetical protein C0598_02110 [Marinilabiliales bacterium]
MKKTWKIFLWIIAGLVVIMILFSGWYWFRANSEMGLMTPLETGKVVDNIYAINNEFVNSYIIEEGKNLIVVDCGNDVETIQKGFKFLKLKPDNVVAVLLTHSDGDHVAALKLFKNAEVYLSREEEQMINGTTSRFFIFGNSIDTDNYILVDDNQEFTIADVPIKGILTPGHTPGLMCYIVNDRFMFTGDALSLKNGKIDEFNDFFNMDSERALKSIYKIKEVENVDYIFTAHYGYSDNFEHAISDID